MYILKRQTSDSRARARSSFGRSRSPRKTIHLGTDIYLRDKTPDE